MAEVNQRHQKELALVQKDLIEKSKRLDVIKFEMQEEANIQLEMKDKEIHLVQN